MRGFFNAAQARHIDYFVMEAFDQPWKTSFEGRAAGYWGMFDLDRHAKWPLTGAGVENPNWLVWALGACLAVAAGQLLLAAGRTSASPASCCWRRWRRASPPSSPCVLLAMGETYLPLAPPWCGARWPPARRCCCSC